MNRYVFVLARLFFCFFIDLLCEAFYPAPTFMPSDGHCFHFSDGFHYFIRHVISILCTCQHSRKLFVIFIFPVSSHYEFWIVVAYFLLLFFVIDYFKIFTMVGGNTSRDWKVSVIAAKGLIVFG